MASKSNQLNPKQAPSSRHEVAAASAVVGKAAPAAAAAPAAPAAVAVPPAPVAAQSVVKERDRSGVVALIAKLRDRDAETARDAAATLATLPVDAEAIGALSAVLINSENYYHPVVRAAAASALGSLGDARGIDALIVATGDSMAETSEEAIKALGKVGDPRALPVLEKVIRNEQKFFLEHVQRAARDAVARIGGRVAKV